MASTAVTTASNTGTKAKTKGRGRKGWVPPMKNQWLETWRPEWDRKHGTASIGALYDKITTRWIRRYGYDLAFEDDPLESTTLDTFFLPGQEKIPGLLGLSEEETAARKAYYSGLRQKLMVWFNHRFKRFSDSAIKDEAKKLFRVIAKQSQSVRRIGSYHYYQKIFYEEKILSTFNERYSAAVAEADRRGEKKPSQIVIRQQVVKEFWDKETPEVKKRVEELVEEDFERRVAEGETVPPSTPEDFESYIENIAPFVGAIAEGLYERTGMLVSVMLAGPIPSDQGRLGVRSFLFGDGNEDGDKPQWPQFDCAGYEAAQASLVAYASTVFTPEDCQARALRQETPIRPPPTSSSANAPVGATSSPSQETPLIPDQENTRPVSPSPPSPPPSSPQSPPTPSPSPPPTSRSSVPAEDEPPSEPLEGIIAPAGPPSSTLAMTTSSASAVASAPHSRRLRTASTNHTPADQSTDEPGSEPFGTQDDGSDSDNSDRELQEWGDVSPSSPRHVLMEHGCPEDLFYVYAPLVDIDLGPSWAHMVNLFVKHQAAACWQDPGGAVLSSDWRPEEYAVWFKHGRPLSGPSIGDPLLFMQNLRHWWRMFQPSCRGDNGTRLVDGENPQVWAKLIRPGRRGIFLILIGLLWAGRYVINDSGLLLHFWQDIVLDINFVLGHDPDLVHAPLETPAEPETSSKLTRKAAGKTKTPSKAKGKSVEQPSSSTRSK